MTRRPLFFLLLSLLPGLPLLAQSGDLTVHFAGDARIAEPRYTYNVRANWSNKEWPAHDLVLEVDLPGTVTDVRGFGFRMQCTTVNPVRCTQAVLTGDQEFAGVSITVAFPGPGTYTATAKVSTNSEEGPAENNFATHTLTVEGLPNLYSSLNFRDESVDPGAEGVVDLGVSNNGAAATNVVARARVEGGTILRAEPLFWGYGPPTSTCTIDGGEVTCHIPEMAASYDFELVRLTYRAPDRRDGGHVVATGTVESDRPDFDPANNDARATVPLRRLFVVTSAGDEGSGTLRQAIVEANALCETVPCTIGFDGVTAIQPRTPLPHLRGTVRIDGGEGRVFLDGVLLSSGDALHFDGGCKFEVRNLFVGNFPGHGIEAHGGSAVSCPPGGGLFVRRTELADNERGIVAKGIDASLRENVIHDHRRAGIFIDGSWYSEIYNNVVVNNGATGIYVNTSTQPQFGGIPPGADIVENVVHGNGEWGIARTRNNGLVQMRRNSMIRNGLYGYDVGLDLSTPDREVDAPGVPNKPTLLDATYDPATDTTLIRGTAPWGSDVDLYASTSLSRYGYPEAESWLGSLWVLQDQKIELTVPGDLRGQWITGTITRGQTLYFLRDDAEPPANAYRPSSGYDTSELSDPVQVQ